MSRTVGALLFFFDDLMPQEAPLNEKKTDYRPEEKKTHIIICKALCEHLCNSTLKRFLNSCQIFLQTVHATRGKTTLFVLMPETNTFKSPAGALWSLKGVCPDLRNGTQRVVFSSLKNAPQSILIQPSGSGFRTPLSHLHHPSPLLLHLFLNFGLRN